MTENAKIRVEEVSLESLVLLGKDKLIDVDIEYPTETGVTRASAKIKQLTMEELKNIDVTEANFRTNLEILKKSLFKQDGTPFEPDLILALPIGVVNALSEKILEISGVNQEVKKQ